MILFAINGRGLFQVKASGGTATPVTVPGMEPCQDCLWPSFLPDARRFLFAVVSATSNRGIYVGSLEGAVPRRVIELGEGRAGSVADASSVSYIEAGYIFYASAGALVARRFDPVTGHAGTDVVQIADRVWYNEGTGRAVFSVSQTRVLAYREPLVSRLEWVSRKGATISTVPEGIYNSFTVARDGRVLASQLDALSGTYDLWLHDSTWAAPRRLTFDPASDLRPLWAKDESAAVFARKGADGWQLYEVKLDRPGAERPLLPQPSASAVGAVSWDGEVLEYSTSGRSAEPSRLWSVRPESAQQPVLIDQDKSNGVQGRVSPDGKWLAYTANETDSRVPNTALFVRRRDNAPGQWPIAPAGSAPHWRSDSRELFFMAPGARLMAQKIEEGGPLGPPVLLCTTEALATTGLAGQAYEAAPDGDRFLIKVAARRPSIIVMSDWLPSSER